MKDVQNTKGGLPKPTKAELLESRLSELIPFSPLPLNPYWERSLRRIIGDLSEPYYQKVLQSWKEQISPIEPRKAPTPAMIGGSEPVDDLLPFFEKRLPDGSKEWQMSGHLYQKRTELLKYADIEDKEIQAASVALMIAEQRVRDTSNLDSEELEYLEPFDPNECMLAFRDLLLPLATKLTQLRTPKTEHDRRKEIRDEALEWVGKIIDHAFPEFFMTSSPERDAVRVIDAAYAFCCKKKRIPTKKEIKSIRKIPWRDTKWRTIFQEAGLGDLHESGKERY